MGGWNIFYAVINFLILTAGLFLIGRKTVLSMYRNYRGRISDDLDNTLRSAEKAEELDKQLSQIRSDAQQECREIVSSAENEARSASLKERKDFELRLKAFEENNGHSIQNIRNDREFLTGVCGEISAAAAADICRASADLLSGSEFEGQCELLTDRFIEDFAHRLVVSQSDRSRVAEGKTVVLNVCSCKALSEKQRSDLISAVASVFGTDNISATFAEEAALIGGLKVSVWDTVYDGTLSSVLSKAEKELADCYTSGENIDSAFQQQINSMDMELSVFQVGKVINLSDGICRVSGLGDVMAGEMLRFEGDLRGMVMDLEKDNVGVVLLGNYDSVQEGDEVRRTGHIIEVPVGEALIGRVVDALGRPVDGAGPIMAQGSRPVESPAPAVIDRKSVSVPMQTGIKAIDALVPIGRGQRELIIGDRQTGKSAIIIDTILNQKGKDLICIYVAIGQKESTVAGFVDKLKEHGAMDYTIVVCANASEPAPMLYIAPYAGAAMGEYFMYGGKDVLIIYDDLSKHAVSYREISLLLHRPPGREAYPGDVFYLHSRLLERAARLSEEAGGGSMTALPIIETQAGDISAYIPTNVISITDGQIFLETDLFNSGVRPAVNVGLSVSRVGGSAQLGAMKQVAGRLRMDLAQYRELAAFSQFGSDLDKATRATLNRGDRMTEILKQGRYSPMDAPDQVVSIFSINEGYADDIALSDVSRFEAELLPYVRTHYPELHDEILSGSKLSPAQLDHLRSVISDFKSMFK